MNTEDLFISFQIKLKQYQKQPYYDGPKTLNFRISEVSL